MVALVFLDSVFILAQSFWRFNAISKAQVEIRKKSDRGSLKYCLESFSKYVSTIFASVFACTTTQQNHAVSEDAYVEYS